MPPSGLSRVLITTDAVGGVWRYALDLAASLGGRNVECLLAGFGPAPDAARVEACARLPNVQLAWLDAPLDWTAQDETALAAAPAQLAALAREWGAELLHLNAPSQAAGLADGFDVVVSSHSCVPTWWECVRGAELPADFAWHRARNLAGFRRAGAAIAPSRAHAAALKRVYGPIPGLRVVCNTTEAQPAVSVERESFVLAAGRWWDEGKGAATLDQAAAAASTPVLAAGPLTGPAGQRATFAHAAALGELSADGVRSLMSRAAIFAAPSRYEPFGLAVLEAATRGCALLLADIPTFRELWQDAAVFADPHDAEAWAGAIARLVRDPRARRSLTVAAVARARKFGPERQLAGVLHGYAAASRRSTVREVA
jgi:glycosyltransferase involved in cell wall biosynthesis